jgi:hypothetical protein
MWQHPKEMTGSNQEELNSLVTVIRMNDPQNVRPNENYIFRKWVLRLMASSNVQILQQLNSHFTLAIGEHSSKCETR